MKDVLIQAGIKSYTLLLAGTKDAAVGVEYRVIHDKNQVLVSLTNLDRHAVKVQLDMSGKAIDLLNDGFSVDVNNISLPPMLPRLLRIIPQSF